MDVNCSWAYTSCWWHKQICSCMQPWICLASAIGTYSPSLQTDAQNWVKKSAEVPLAEVLPISTKCWRVTVSDMIVSFGSKQVASVMLQCNHSMRKQCSWQLLAVIMIMLLLQSQQEHRTPQLTPKVTSLGVSQPHHSVSVMASYFSLPTYLHKHTIIESDSFVQHVRNTSHAQHHDVIVMQDWMTNMQLDWRTRYCCMSGPDVNP